MPVQSLVRGGSHRPRSNEVHAPQPLSLCLKAQELQLLNPWAVTAEACTPQLESSPPCPSFIAAERNSIEDPAQPKIKKIFFKLGFHNGLAVKNLPANAGNMGDWDLVLGWEDPLK